MNVSLSDEVIKRLAPDLNVVVYSQLSNMTCEQVLNKMPLVILYQDTPSNGHWTLLHQTPEGIEFFDPYGFEPDKEFSMLSFKQPHYIAKLLYRLHNAGYRINYNQYPLQQFKPGVNTCGRHVLIRHKYAHLPIDKYVQRIKQLAQQHNINLDQLMVMLT